MFYFLSIVKNTINLIIYNLIFKFIDYIRFSPIKQDVRSTFSQYRLMYNLPNVPEAFNEKYFPKKEVENLLELKDIIN